MIGLSLSFCIKDILDGLIAEEDVEKLVTGTRCRTDEHWARLLETYRAVYWRDNPDEGEAIMWRFIKAGKVKQPLLEGFNDAHNIANGHWMDTQGNRFFLPKE